ncbi:hypothetical protein [Corynebacterium nuruki]|jgi:hypothetical protein
MGSVADIAVDVLKNLGLFVFRVLDAAGELLGIYKPGTNDAA